MKVLIISNLWTPYARGGAERVAEREADELIHRGHSVSVLTARPFAVSGLFPVAKMHNAISLWHVYPLNFLFYTHMMKQHSVVRLLWHIIDMLQIHTLFVTMYVIYKEQPDEVHTHNLKGIGLLIPVAIHLMQVPHHHTVHDMQLITPSGVMLAGNEKNWEHTGIVTRLYRRFVSLLFGSPSVVLFPSRWLHDEHTKYNFFAKSEQRVVHNLPRAEFVGAHQPLRNHHMVVRCVYIGQLEQHKGIMLLVACVSLLHNVELSVFGSGSLTSYVNAMSVTYPHITNYGEVDSVKIVSALKDADVLIYPSVCYENCPMAIVEAKAMGVSVIASRIGGIPELCDDTDILFTADSSKELQSAILTMQKRCQTPVS